MRLSIQLQVLSGAPEAINLGTGLYVSPSHNCIHPKLPLGNTKAPCLYFLVLIFGPFGLNFHD